MNTHSFSPKCCGFVKVRHVSDSRELSAGQRVEEVCRGGPQSSIKRERSKGSKRTTEWFDSRARAGLTTVVVSCSKKRLWGNGTIGFVKLSVPDRRFYFSLVLIVGLAAWWRFAGISVEPFWLDEVFTVSLSSGTLEDIVIANARDTHPPLYSLGVAVVRQVLGDSEVVIRGCSTALSLLGIVIVMFFGRDLGGLRVSIMAGLLAALNPLDIYYAQEARMYSQAATLATASSWFLWRWLRSKLYRKKLVSDWRLWAVLYCGAAVLLCFTHLVGAMVLLAQGLLAVGYFVWQRRFRQAAAFLAIGLLCVAAVAFWASFVIGVRGVFFSRANLEWISAPTLSSGFRFLVDQFFLAFCGGMLGDIREWVSVMAWVLMVFVLGSTFVHSVRYAKFRNTEGQAAPKAFDRGYLLWLMFGPVFAVLLTSWLFQPVYFPPRFSLLVLSPFLILVALECNQLKSKALRVGTFSVFLVLMGVGAWCQASVITKTGMADFAQFWHKEGPPDVAVFSPGHNRVMAAYYTGQKIPPVDQASLEERVRSAESTTVWICLEAGVSTATDWAGNLVDWAIGLGPHEQVGSFDRMLITEVTVDRPIKVFPSLPGHHQIDFSVEGAERYLWFGWHRAEKKHRWSRGQRAEVVFSLKDPQRFSGITMEMFCFHRQRITAVLNQKTIDSFVCEKRTPHLHESIVPQGIFDTENTLAFVLPDAIAPNQVSESRDARILALGIRRLRLVEGE